MKKWFFGAILLLALGASLQLGLLMYSMYVFLGVLLVSQMMARQWAENVTAYRKMSRTNTQIGETIEVVVTLKNHGRTRIAWLLIEDSLPKQALLQKPPRIRMSGKRTQLLTLKSGGQVALRYKVTFEMRGYYQIGPMLAETGDLFGLHRRYRIVTEPWFVLVPPQVVPLTGYDISTRRPIGEIRLTHRLFEDPTRMAGVRQYQNGDPLNRIHWMATARTGELHSRQYEPSCLAGATFLLDFHVRGFSSRGEPFRSELAVKLVASLANAVTLMGQQIGFVTNGRDAADRVREEGWRVEFRTRDDARQEFGMLPESTRLQPLRLPSGRGPEQFTRLIEMLARLELSDGLTCPQLIAESLLHLPRDAGVVAILSEAPDETAIALGNLRRSGYAVTAVLILQRDNLDYAESAGRLIAQGIDVRHVEDDAGIADFCSSHVLM
jgi:uncharacterized repeat protein (TIGR01451 family)